MVDKNSNNYIKYESVAKIDKEEEKEVKINIKAIDQISHNRSRTFLYIAACTANLAAFTSGVTIGWSSPVLPKLQNSTQTNLNQLITESESGWLGSLLPLGAIFGPFLGGFFAEKIGRKKTLLYGSLPFILGLATNIFAKTVNYLLISRFICGISVGVTFTVTPIYAGEIAEDSVRGILGSLLQLFTVIGLLFSFVIGPFTSITVFNSACLIAPVTFVVIFALFIPESPYYLLKTGQNEAAEAALMQLRDAASSEMVSKEIDTLRASLEESAKDKANFLDIFQSKGLTRAYLISSGLLILQQFSGINVILFFAQSIFKDAGVILAPEFCTIIIGVVQVIFSGITSLIVDKRGKRNLLMHSAIIMAISIEILAVFFYLKDNLHANMAIFSWIPIVCLIAYIMGFCLGFGPIPWAIMGEIFPQSVKSVATTANSATSWFLAFILTKYFSNVAQLIGKSFSFGLFGVSCVGAFIFVYYVVPETSGKSLQEIQDILNNDGKKTNTVKNHPESADNVE